MGVWYCTREDLRAALDFKDAALGNAQIDRAIEAASRSVEGYLHRRFYPQTGTRYFNWPTRDGYSWRIELNADEIVSLTSIITGNSTLNPAYVFLEPVNYGPPYDRIELNTGSIATFSVANTSQRSVAVTGVFGYGMDETSVGTLAEALDTSETSVDVNGAASALLGVGSVVRVDSERMLVIGRSALDTGQNLLTPVSNNKGETAIAVSDGSSFAVGETIVLDAERMAVIDVVGNTLIVKRAWDGTVLASHTGSDIYAYRTLTVLRGALGTTAVSHIQGSTVQRFDFPGPVRELALAEAINNLEQARAAYARTAGSGDNERPTNVPGLEQLRKNVRRSHGRKARTRSV
jgi:hypothetical protein